jgi:hypothetical protein
VRPAGLVADSTSVPVKPLNAATVIIELPVCPGVKATLVGLAVMLKHEEAVTSTTTTVE